MGFGAGTLANMQLTFLLLLQVSHEYPILICGLLCALPTPCPTSAVPVRQRQVLTASRSKHFCFFTDRVSCLVLLLLLSRDVELNPSLLNTQELKLFKSLQNGQAKILSKLEATDTGLAKHEAMMAEINGKLRVTESQITALKVNVQERAIRTITKAANFVIRALTQKIEAAEIT